MAADAHGKSTEIAASFALLGATALALVLANSGLAGAYKAVLATEIRLGIGGWELADQVKGWIKNALMAVFFRGAQEQFSLAQAAQGSGPRPD